MDPAAAAEEFPIPFLPTEGEILHCLLRPKIAGAYIDSRFTHLVHEADVFSLPPDQLAAMHAHAPGARGDKAWYFFTTRIGSGGRGRRVGGDGTKRWCSVGSKKELAGGGGYCRRFRYREKTANGVVAPGWMMLEYGVVSQEHAVGDGVADLVLCRFFRSPRAARSDSKSPSSSASASASVGRKRKAEALLCSDG
uniref:NAC domain-containing protein n=1 Tax=Leersia perrieri TaxID=77586 RepID=A0A0D9WYX9_9ORYZ